MKTILIIMLLLTTLYAEHTLLVSGLSKHGTSSDRYGEKFNGEHYGLGYSYSTYNEDKIFYSGTALIFSDSYKNMMYSATYGVNYMLHDEDYRLSVGAEFGLAYKKSRFVDDYNDYFKYRVTPIAFIPKMSIEYERVSLNFTYVPHVDFKYTDDGVEHRGVFDEVLYINVGYRF